LELPFGIPSHDTFGRIAHDSSRRIREVLPSRTLLRRLLPSMGRLCGTPTVGRRTRLRFTWSALGRPKLVWSWGRLRPRKNPMRSQPFQLPPPRGGIGSLKSIDN
jgi:hypothetical protein